MEILEQIPSKEYFIEHNQEYFIYAKDRVKEVREYLELECGFDKAQWTTDNYLDLIWIYVNSNGYVHGDRDNVTGRKKCTIDNLLDGYKLYSGCRPINLKE